MCLIWSIFNSISHRYLNYFFIHFDWCLSRATWCTELQIRELLHYWKHSDLNAAKIQCTKLFQKLSIIEKFYSRTKWLFLSEFLIFARITVQEDELIHNLIIGQVTCHQTVPQYVSLCTYYNLNIHNNMVPAQPGPHHILDSCVHISHLNQQQQLYNWHIY